MNSFSPDTRNIGGRKVISHMMALHQNRLLSVQPTLKRLGDMSARRRGLSHTVHDREKFGEIKQRFRRTKNGGTIRKLLDDAPDISDTISYNKKLKQLSNIDTHERLFRRMQKRINEYPQPHDRKKNPWDTSNTPVLFIRHKPDVLPWIHKAKRISKKALHKKTSISGEELLDMITTNRLFRDEELENLYDWVRQNYTDKNSVEKAIRFVKKYID